MSPPIDHQRNFSLYLPRCTGYKYAFVIALGLSIISWLLLVNPMEVVYREKTLKHWRQKRLPTVSTKVPDQTSVTSHGLPFAVNWKKKERRYAIDNPNITHKVVFRNKTLRVVSAEHLHKLPLLNIEDGQRKKHHNIHLNEEMPRVYNTTAKPVLARISNHSRTRVREPYLKPANLTTNEDPFVLARGMGGRLGNQLFEYATAYALALMNNMTLKMYTEFFKDIKVIFDLKDPDMNMSKFDDIAFEQYQVLVCEGKSTSYNPIFKNITLSKTIVIGYCQSWMYFNHVRGQIRRKFTFSDVVTRTATDFIKLSIKEKQITNAVIIGVHVRRGDHTSDWGTAYGYVAPNVTYFQRAMWYFDQKYINTLYLILSENTGEDPPWAVENIVHPRVVHSQNHSAEVDLAILSLCNHTIISVGTFGWWGAFLNGGEAIYFNQWPRPGSELSENIRGNEYFCPWWIGMPN